MEKKMANMGTTVEIMEMKRKLFDYFMYII